MISNPPIPPRDDPEARLTALLLGELPPAEAAQLRQAIAQDPALAALHDQLQKTIPLVQEALRAPAAVPGPKISDTKRQALLARLKTAPPQPVRKPVIISWFIPLSAAASLIGLLVLYGILVPDGWPTARRFATASAPAAPASVIPGQEFGSPSSVREERHFAVVDSSGGLANIPPSPPPVSDPAGAVTQPSTPAKRGRAAFGIQSEYLAKAKVQPQNGVSLGYAFSESKSAASPGVQEADDKLARFYHSAATDAKQLGETVSTAPQAGNFLLERSDRPAAASAPKASSGSTFGSGAPSGGRAGGMGGGGERNRGSVAAESPARGMKANQWAAQSGGLLALGAAAPASESRRKEAEGQRVELQLADTASKDLDSSSLGKSFNGRAQAGVAIDRVEQKLSLAADQPVARFSSADGLVADREGAKPAAAELAPLPIQFPKPAFKGTPVDLPSDTTALHPDRERYASTPAGPALRAKDAFAPAPAAPMVAPPPPAALASPAITAAPAPAEPAGKPQEITAFGPEAKKRAGKPQDMMSFGSMSSEPAAAGRRLAGVAGRAAATRMLVDKDTDDLRKVEVAKKLERLAEPLPEAQPEVQTRENAFSTFSMNIADVSFKLAAASLEKGVPPDRATLRSEEFINAMDYRDPEPAPGAPLAFACDRARYPFAHNRDVIRFAIKTGAMGRQSGRPMNLVILLDNSGSMERADRVRIRREALKVLAARLEPRDIISVVAFARSARLWVDGLPGTRAGELVERAGSLNPEGGTNLEEAMDLGYQTALRHYQAQGINRVVLLTDGAANLGSVDPALLKQKVEQHRRQGIALDCFGIGWEGYNDDLLEVLARNGDGRYGFVNSPEEAATGFAAQLAGALSVAASDVKVQVEFNPARVTAWRLVGYAKHQLKKEQFRDNTVDAAEIAAAETGNALYIIETNPRGSGPVGTVRVRYKIPGTSDYHEHAYEAPYTGPAPELAQAGPALRLAVTAGAFCEWLQGSPYGAEAAPARLLPVLAGVPQIYGRDPRPRQLETMIRQAAALGGR